ncbi:MAG: tetratricopeptide repeat protein [Candidatus Omnitrophica bacterium]|nr:tetratricopeptide repeat protein [Candidatus Omnitrophota bacterium]
MITKRTMLLGVLLLAMIVITCSAMAQEKSYNEMQIELTTKAISNNPNDVSAYYQRAGIYHEQGELDLALIDYNKVIELKPDFSTLVYCGRGDVYTLKGDFDKAIADYSKAIEMQPDFDYSYYLRAIAYANKKEYNKSWADVHKAEGLGYPVKPEFLAELKKASGRDK